MQYTVKRISGHHILPVAEIKNYLRVSHDYDDLWITNLIAGSIEAAENFLRSKLLPCNVSVNMRYTQSNKLRMPIGHISNIEKISVSKSRGDYVIVASNEYTHCSEMITITSSYIYDMISIDYIAGYQDTSNIPASIKQGIMLQVAEAYDNRAASFSISEEIRRLYMPYKKMML